MSSIPIQQVPRGHRAPSATPCVSCQRPSHPASRPWANTPPLRSLTTTHPLTTCAAATQTPPVETVAEPTPLPNCLLVVGFHPDETTALQQHIRAAHPQWHVAPVLRDDLQHDVTTLLERCASGDLHPHHTDPAHVLLGVGRIVLCSGQDVLRELYELQGLLVDEDSEEQPPPMFGVVADNDVSGTLGQRLEAVRTAFGEVHGLMLPLSSGQVEDPDLQTRLDATHCVLHATMDAALVPSCSGAGPRSDASRVVALDGLLSDAECHALLCWLVGEKIPDGPEHPITERHLHRNWEQRCVDFAGAPPTWGLKTDLLRKLRDDPPPAVLRLQSRLQTLYPEYHLAFMPGAGLADEEDEEGGAPLSSFVGNAVVAGQQCDWHQDMDPACLPPMSPWVQQHSWYYNREPGKPLFVSMLLYLNRSWAPELHAETLFVDPDSGTGVFVQPRAGRVVLMDQDVPHRIGAASPMAGDQPRFSLVWKLVFWPQQDYAQGLANSQLQEMSLARPQWGAPVHLGSPSSA